MTKISSRMNQISQHINIMSHKFHSYDQMIKMVVDLGRKKGDKNGDYYSKLMYLHNYLLMKNIDNPEKYVSHVKVIFLTSKFCSYYSRYSSSFFCVQCVLLYITQVVSNIYCI